MKYDDDEEEEEIRILFYDVNDQVCNVFGDDDNLEVWLIMIMMTRCEMFL